MAISNVTIANMALIELGASRINSLTDGSKAAITCNIMFDRARDETLRTHEWNCAIERQELNQLSEGPITDDWEHRYQLPVDPPCLRVINIPDRPKATWRIEGQYLLTNESSPLIIRYIKEIKDPSLFDSLLVKAIAYRLASDIANSLSDDANKKAQMEALYDRAIAEAKSIDADESKEPNPEPDYWHEVGR